MAKLLMVAEGFEEYEGVIKDAVQVAEALRVEVVVGIFGEGGGKWFTLVWVDKAGAARQRVGAGWRRWEGGEWVEEGGIGVGVEG